MKNILVVGSGVAGLYSSFELLRRGHKVTLVDKAPEVGGLLKTVENEHGDQFDCGAHFLRDTGIADIDDHIFKNLSDDWRRLPFLKIGTYSEDKYYGFSSFPDARHLPKDTYHKGIAELLAIEPDEGPYETSADYLTRRFGPTFRDNIFREPIEKFYGEKLENLAPLSSRSFDLVRIIAFDPEKTRELKKVKWNDDRLAFHYSDEGQSGLMNYYPASGGIGQWVEIMKEKILGLGGKILLEDEVVSMDFSDSKISSYKSQSGLESEVDQVVWTVPVPFLLKHLGLKYNTPRPRIRTSVLVDMVTDKPFETDVFYNVCFSDKYKAFRTTYYPNVNSKEVDNGRYCTCMEVIVEPSEVETVNSAECFEELRTMGFVAQDAKLTWSRKRVEAAGFPVTTNEFVNSMAEIRNYAVSQVNNLTLAGKAGGKVFFMNETLVDTYHQIEGL